MKKEKREHRSIDGYIRAFPEHTRKKLAELRKIVREQAPHAQEKISYRMPAFFLNRNLVYFAGYSRHIGFYPGTGCDSCIQTQTVEVQKCQGLSPVFAGRAVAGKTDQTNGKIQS